MPKRSYSINTPYTAAKLFDLVADIKSYPEFLPWCVAARILDIQDNVIIAELLIKYKIFRNSYTSKVTLIPKQEIHVALENGPFKYLYNHWKFTDIADGCMIEFMLDFEFSAGWLEQIISSEFDRYADKMMAAFVQRANEIYEI